MSADGGDCDGDCDGDCGEFGFSAKDKMTGVFLLQFIDTPQRCVQGLQDVLLVCHDAKSFNRTNDMMY